MRPRCRTEAPRRTPWRLWPSRPSPAGAAAGVDPGDIAVLARVNSALLAGAGGLHGGGRPLHHPARRPASWSAPASAPPSPTSGSGPIPDSIRREDVPETIRRPSRGIAPNGGGHDHQAVNHVDRPTSAGLPAASRAATSRSCEAYADDLDAVAKAGRRSSTAALEAIRVGIGLDDTMDVLDSLAHGGRPLHPRRRPGRPRIGGGPAPRSRHLRALAATGSRPATGRRARPCCCPRCIAIKGREWGHVIVFGASRGLFPHRLGDDEEGERRVFHVALTRARTPGRRPRRRRGPVDLPRRT